MLPVTGRLLAVAAVCFSVAVCSPQDASAYELFTIPDARSQHLSVVKAALNGAGLQQVANYSGEGPLNWDIMWSFRHPFANQDLRPALELARGSHAKINHFPGIGHLTSKDTFGYRMADARKLFPEDFRFTPRTFTLPKQFDKFEKAFLETQDTAQEGDERIVKWLFKNQGHRGIRPIFDSAEKDLDVNKGLAQEYIMVHLIDGFKYDIGLYVLITSVNPLRFYIFDEVLARVCKRPYPKTMDGFQEDDDESFVIVDYQPLWNLPSIQKHYNGNNAEAFQAYFAEQGEEGKKLWPRLHDTIAKSLIAVTANLQKATANWGFHDGNLFEMVRFDFLVDHAFQPQLLEVNMSPNLVPKNAVDRAMKDRLMSTVFSLMGVHSGASWRAVSHAALQEVMEKQQPDYCTSGECDFGCTARCILCAACLSDADTAFLETVHGEYSRKTELFHMYPRLGDNSLERFLPEAEKMKSRYILQSWWARSGRQVMSDARARTKVLLQQQQQQEQRQQQQERTPQPPPQPQQPATPPPPPQPAHAIAPEHLPPSEFLAFALGVAVTLLLVVFVQLCCLLHVRRVQELGLANGKHKSE